MWGAVLWMSCMHTFPRSSTSRDPFFCCPNSFETFKFDRLQRCTAASPASTAAAAFFAMDDGMEQPDYAQAYHSHSYLDPLQAQAIAAYMPDFATMDPASQAAAMQQYSQAMPPEEPPAEVNELLPGFRIETESEAEEGGAAQQGLSTAAADALATKGDDAWTEAEESDLLRLVNDMEFREAMLAETSTKWAPVARYFKRTVKEVKRKYDKLQNPDKETRKSTRVVRSTAAAQAAAQQQEEEEEYAAAAGADGQLHQQQQQQQYDPSAAPEAAQQGAEGMTADEHAAAVAAAAAGVSGAQPAAHQEMMAHMYTMGMGHEEMYAAGAEGGLTEEQAAAALQGNAEAHGMTPEQMAAYMHAYSGFYGDPNEAAAAAEGQQQQQEQDPSADVHPALLQQLAAQQAAAYQAEAAAAAAVAQQHAAQQQEAQATPPPLQHHVTPPPQSPPPEQHQGSGVGGGTTNQPRNDRVFWKADEQQELLRIVQDPAYRQQVLGVGELNWDTVAKHLGRGKRSVQRKYDNLKGAMVNGDGTLTLPANDGKKWTPEEVSDLVRLVEDAQYRAEKLAMDKVDWRVLGQHFGRSYESVSYKYSYVKNTGRTGNEGKPKHAKAKHETSYKEMAIWALQQIGGEGTSGQICNMIATNNVYSPQLDTAIVSGKKTLQRWKHGVRSALNAFPMFKKTPRIFEGEVVWHLVEEAVASEAAAAQEKALRQRNKPMSGAARRKIKKPLGEEGGGVAGEEGAQEEGAQQALAQMASHRAPGGRKRKASAMAQAAQAEAEAAAHAAAAAAATAAAHAQHHAAIDASAMAGMDPQQMEMLAAQAQMPLLQQIFDPDATITAEQLAMLPPEHLAMLQQQMDAGQLGQQLPVLPLVMPDGQTVEGHAAVDGSGVVAAEHAHHHHHMSAEQAHHHAAAMHAAQAGGHHYHDPTQAAAHYDPAHYDAQAAAAQHAAMEQHYATAHDASAHDPALAAQHQQQMADHYAATGMMDPSGAGQHGMHTGVHLGQPMGHHQGMDGMAGLGQQVQGYDHYGQYHQPYQQYQQYQYDPSQYQQYDTSQMATYGVPQQQQQQQQ